MDTMKKTALTIPFLGFMMGSPLCHADTKEIARDGIYAAYDNGIVRDTRGTRIQVDV